MPVHPSSKKPLFALTRRAYYNPIPVNIPTSEFKMHKFTDDRSSAIQPERNSYSPPVRLKRRFTNFLISLLEPLIASGLVLALSLLLLAVIILGIAFVRFSLGILMK